MKQIREIPKYDIDVLDANQTLSEMAYDYAQDAYGTPLPLSIDKRLQQELNIIRELNCADYIIHLAVDSESRADGRLQSDEDLTAPFKDSIVCELLIIR